jgi:hypothetical protein
VCVGCGSLAGQCEVEPLFVNVTSVPFFTVSDVGLKPSPEIVIVAVAGASTSVVTVADPSVVTSTPVTAPPVLSVVEVVVVVPVVAGVVSKDVVVEHPAPRSVRVAPRAAHRTKKVVCIRKKIKAITFVV